MREERQQRQDRDDLHLKPVGPMRHPFGESVQLEVKVPDGKNHDDEKHHHPDEEAVGPSRGGNEPGQVVRGQRVRCFRHLTSLSNRRDGKPSSRRQDCGLPAGAISPDANHLGDGLIGNHRPVLIFKARPS